MALSDRNAWLQTELDRTANLTDFLTDWSKCFGNIFFQPSMSVSLRLYPESFMTPHKKKLGGVRSGERGSLSIFPLPNPALWKKLSSQERAWTLKWAGAPSCWNHVISCLANRKQLDKIFHPAFEPNSDPLQCLQKKRSDEPFRRNVTLNANSRGNPFGIEKDVRIFFWIITVLWPKRIRIHRGDNCSPAF